MLCKKMRKIAFELRAVGDDLEETALPWQLGLFHYVHSPTRIAISCLPAQQVMPISLRLDHISAPITYLVSKYSHIFKAL